MCDTRVIEAPYGAEICLRGYPTRLHLHYQTTTAICTRTAQRKSLVEIQFIKSLSFSVLQLHIHILPQLDIEIPTKILQRILLVVISDEPSGDGPVDVLPGIRGRVKIRRCVFGLAAAVEGRVVRAHSDVGVDWGCMGGRRGGVCGGGGGGGGSGSSIHLLTNYVGDILGLLVGIGWREREFGDEKGMGEALRLDAAKLPRRAGGEEKRAHLRC
jgi:hypothetical protein